MTIQNDTTEDVLVTTGEEEAAVLAVASRALKELDILEKDAEDDFDAINLEEAEYLAAE